MNPSRESLGSTLANHRPCDARVKRLKRGLERGDEEEGWRAASRKVFRNRILWTRIVATPLPTFPSPALNRTKEGEEGEEGWKRRIRRPQIQKINLLNSLVKRIEGSLLRSFPVCFWKRLMSFQFSLASRNRAKFLVFVNRPRMPDSCLQQLPFSTAVTQPEWTNCCSIRIVNAIDY